MNNALKCRNVFSLTKWKQNFNLVINIINCLNYQQSRQELRTNTKMKKLSLLSILGLSIFYTIGQADTSSHQPAFHPVIWTAEQAVAFALSENPDSTIANIRIKEAQATVTAAKSTDYPLINLSTEYGQTDNPMYSFGTILNQGAFDDSINFNNPGRTDNLQLKTQISYRLYNGGRDQADQAAAEANLNISQTDLLATHQRLAFEVVKTFQAIIQAEKMVTVREEALDSITAALEVGQARFDAGSLLKQELLNLELQRSLAVENLIQSRHVLELTKRSFLNLLGLQEGQVAIDHDSGSNQEIPKSIDYQNRQELKRLEGFEQVALAELRKAQGGKLPTVDTFVSYQMDTGAVLDETGDSWMAGVQMNYVLFDGQKSSSQITKARLKLKEIQNLRKKTELALNLEVQQALLDYEQAKQRLSVTDKMVDVAEEVIRLSRARFSEGVILASDLIDFEMRLSDAQARQVAAIAGYQVAIANLRRATGLEQFPTKYL
jgi:outer membrane protein TolC